MATAARMPWMRRKVRAESMSNPGPPAPPWAPFRPPPGPLPLPPRGSELLLPLEGKKLLPPFPVASSLLEPEEG